MTDILELLASVIGHVGEERRSEFPSFPPASAQAQGTGTGIPLVQNAVPVLPVFPAASADVADDVVKLSNAAIAEPREMVLEEPYLLSTGNTGNTGNAQESSVSSCSRSVPVSG